LNISRSRSSRWREIGSFSRAEICTLRSQTHSFSTIPHSWLYLPSAEMTLDLEANEVEVKALTSLASVTETTDCRAPYYLDGPTHSVDDDAMEGHEIGNNVA
jgi:hypothetical protein